MMFSRLLSPIKRKLSLMVTRGLVNMIKDSDGLQIFQLSALAGELLDDVERVQNYGMTSHPHPDAEAVILNVGGNRSHPIIIALDDRRYRLHLGEGEVALYDDLGQFVKLSRTGIVMQSPKGTSHNGNMVVNGDLLVTGKTDIGGNASLANNVDISGVLTLAGININAHTHGGITTGGASTGPAQ